jgi:hypothetical protein
MPTKEHPTQEQFRTDQRLRKAMQRFFVTVDDALAAAAAAKRARRDLDRIVGKTDGGQR